jgi:hypothetical protein
MKRIWCLAVLIALTSSAYAGSFSFRVGSHRVHIESPRHCRSASCTSVRISKSLNWRHRRDRNDDDRDAAAPAKPVPPAPQTVSPPAPPAITVPAKTIVEAPPPAIYTPAASTTQIAAAPPPPPPALPPTEQVSIPVPPVTKPAEAAQPAAPLIERVTNQTEEEPSDSPIGDWQTEGKGTVRIAKCGNALCGYALGSSNEKGEAILINMKLKAERQWTGNVYNQKSGETYYGTMSMKAISTLRVETCAFGRFYCSGNDWIRVTRRADSVVSSWPASAEPRSYAARGNAR